MPEQEDDFTSVLSDEDTSSSSGSDISLGDSVDVVAKTANPVTPLFVSPYSKVAGGNRLANLLGGAIAQIEASSNESVTSNDTTTATSSVTGYARVANSNSAIGSTPEHPRSSTTSSSLFQSSSVDSSNPSAPVGGDTLWPRSVPARLTAPVSTSSIGLSPLSPKNGCNPLMAAAFPISSNNSVSPLSSSPVLSPRQDTHTTGGSIERKGSPRIQEGTDKLPHPPPSERSPSWGDYHNASPSWSESRGDDDVQVVLNRLSTLEAEMAGIKQFLTQRGIRQDRAQAISPRASATSPLPVAKDGDAMDTSEDESPVHPLHYARTRTQKRSPVRSTFELGHTLSPRQLQFARSLRSAPNGPRSSGPLIVPGRKPSCSPSSAAVRKTNQSPGISGRTTARPKHYLQQAWR
eukprot:NODE_2078_length_1518_cov_54.739068_g1978_i0.p1 GENE.NODE_2078_length_1518_cov_54.739068_g1978_i0~~NODE_2078_length_1518_cov_54.739068_g1978_i0.p1  ORF type:complete len:406 (+),score=35.79 NODE_2078_length_1518_cov_54.739068_g1978_i0:90-1307(+)